MAMDAKLKARVKDYILTEYHKGFSFTAIEKVLVDRGYQAGEIKEIVDEISHESTVHHMLKGLPFVIASILVIAIVLSGIVLFALTGQKECDTQTCFLQYANDCNPAVYISNEDGTIYEYKVDNECTFTKTITQVSSNEPLEIINLFEGKSLTCEYIKGNFEQRWITTLLGSLNRCTGELKEALYELTIAQYKATEE